MNIFKTKYPYIALCSPLIILGGCASNSELENRLGSLRAEYQGAATSAEVMEFAPLAISEADEALDKAEDMIEDGASKNEVETQLYIAKRKIEIAIETSKNGAAERSIEQAELRRNELLLRAREGELAVAKQNAELLEDRAEAAELYAQQMQDKANRLASEVDDLTMKQTERGMVLTLGNILFELNEAELKSGSERSLNTVANFLLEYPERSVLIEGFTDSTGDESYNQELSKRRAQTVKETLANFGVKPERLDTRGYGEEYPLASNDTSAGRQQNRRVELIVANRSGETVDNRVQ